MEGHKDPETDELSTGDIAVLREEQSDLSHSDNHPRRIRPFLSAQQDNMNANDRVVIFNVPCRNNLDLANDRSDMLNSVVLVNDTVYT